VKGMNLYRDSKISQILTEAVHIAHEKEDDLQPTHFSHLDMLHYLGEQGLTSAASKCGLGNTHEVLDVGAGVGGPARFLSFVYGCKVTGIEFLPQLVRAGKVLNKLMLFKSHCQHVHPDSVRLVAGDFTKFDLGANKMQARYDLLVSQLAMLHIPNKQTLYSQCSVALKPGASFFIEDFFVLHPLTENEKAILEGDVAVPDGYLPTKQEYINFLESNGLLVDIWEDKTREWASFVWQRYEAFLNERETHSQKHGPLFSEEMAHFYQQIAKLYHQQLGSEENPSHFTHPKVWSLLKLDGWIPPSSQNIGGVWIFGHKRG